MRVIDEAAFPQDHHGGQTSSQCHEPRVLTAVMGALARREKAAPERARQPLFQEAAIQVLETALVPCHQSCLSSSISTPGDISASSAGAIEASQADVSDFMSPSPFTRPHFAASLTVTVSS